ncbi:MAG: ABC transporter ATP-binding protein [Gammaproteobacteria bacterium]|nr:ABC transporter ATP-binding protein [Gammaproteobacteria bacterium]
MNAIEINNVHKHYASLHALKGISLEIQQGEFFGLLGPNGAGKSTLISIMAGLTQASRGSVSVMGHDVVQAYRQSRHSLGIVPQELVYDPFFSVRELLRLQSGYFGLRHNDDWIDELLDTLNLSDKANANVQELSGGMKRRMLIAQAMVHKPPVLVLDEPTAGVDVELRQQLWEFACRLHNDGHTIVLTTHYLEEAEALCERIAIINRGEMVALDSKQALLARCPERKLTLTLSDTGSVLPASLEQDVISRDDRQLVIKLDKQQGNVGDILSAVQSSGAQLIDLHIEEPGLEEVFIELTRQQHGQESTDD